MEEDFYRKLIEHLFDGIYFVDTQKTITVWNRSAERITGYGAQEVIGSRCSDNLLRHTDDAGKELCRDGCPLAETLLDGNVREAEVFLHHKNGHRVPVSIKISPIFDDQGSIIGAVEIFSDNSRNSRFIDEIKRLEQKVLIDPLTGIGNRKSAEMHLETRFFELNSHGISFGILFMDIDHFKKVNDTYGHSVGDRVLTMVATTVSNLLRHADVVARWGGEEFIVIIPDIDSDTLYAIAERIRMFIEKSWVEHNGELINVTVSIGGAIARAGDAIADIVHLADTRMYASKRSGRNRVTIEP